ncbi:response regulator transcription factor [Roseateles sp.]|uniref:response regulator n=1 Tax=Roseateles sp. TaxID=1971397 RepID=UPI0026002529|nr:response regulator transcription factor [Roseateles sp.]MBV8036195.1 response regulator transcription factor [Roseateles sp.]
MVAPQATVPQAAAPQAAVAPFGVLLVDDQLAVREGLAKLIACAPLQLCCLGTAANSAQAMHAVRSLRPDVVVLDVDLGGEDGLAMLPLLLPLARVLVLTCHGDPATRERALRLGAQAFIEKHRPAAELLDAMVRLGRMRGEECPAGQGSSSSRDMEPSSAARPLRRS